MSIDSPAAVRDDVQRILGEILRDAIREVEGGADRISTLMVELLLESSSEDVQLLADDFGAAANGLFAALDRRFEALCREIGTANDDGDEKVAFDNEAD